MWTDLAILSLIIVTLSPPPTHLPPSPPFPHLLHRGRAVGKKTIILLCGRTLLYRPWVKVLVKEVDPRISRLKGSTFCAAACSRRKNYTPSQLLARPTRAKKSHCSCRKVKLCSSLMMMSSEELIPVACNSSDDVIWPGQVAGQGTYRSWLNCVPLRAVPSSPRIRAAKREAILLVYNRWLLPAKTYQRGS